MDAEPSGKRNLATLERGMQILRAFQTNDDGLSNAELSARTGIPKSAVSRLTQTLLDLGFLIHAGRKSKYRPGPGLLALGRVANDTLPFVRNSRAAHQMMANDTNVQVIMTLREGAHLMLISARLPENGSSPFYDVGHRIPMFGSAAGLCYLAALSQDEFAALLPMLRRTYGLSDLEIYQHLQNVRRALLVDGFYQPPIDNYFNASIRAVAVPMRSASLGQPVVLSAVAGRDAKTDVEFREYIGPKLSRLVLGTDADLSPIPQAHFDGDARTRDDANVQRINFAEGLAAKQANKT